MLTLPNILTLSRIALLPFMVAGFFMEPVWGSPVTWGIFALYGVSAITDFLDGWAARKLNQISPLGTFLDPIADKIFVAALLVLLVAFGRLTGLYIIPVILILAREFAVSGLREFLGPQDIKLPVTTLAKWKTTTQMLSLGLLILAPAVPYTLVAGQGLLLVATLLTLITGGQYLRAGLKILA